MTIAIVLGAIVVVGLMWLDYQRDCSPKSDDEFFDRQW